MNILLFSDSDQYDDSLIKLDGRRHKHIRHVLKAVKGDNLRVGQIGGKTGSGIIEFINEEYVLIKPEIFENPPEKIPLTLIISMSRPKSMKKVIRYGTAMGISSFVIINSWKADKSYWQSPFFLEQNIKEEMLMALEQSGDTCYPEISFYRLFKPFVEDVLPKLVKKICLVAHPYAEKLAPSSINCPSVVAIGPEGGFIPYEIEKFEEAGFFSVNMGPRILRVENAVAAITARLFT